MHITDIESFLTENIFSEGKFFDKKCIVIQKEIYIGVGRMIFNRKLLLVYNIYIDNRKIVFEILGSNRFRLKNFVKLKKL